MKDTKTLRKEIEDLLQDRPYILEKMKRLEDMVKDIAYMDGYHTGYSEAQEDNY